MIGSALRTVFVLLVVIATISLVQTPLGGDQISGPTAAPSRDGGSGGDQSTQGLSGAANNDEGIRPFEARSPDAKKSATGSTPFPNRTVLAQGFHAGDFSATASRSEAVSPSLARGPPTSSFV